MKITDVKALPVWAGRRNLFVLKMDFQAGFYRPQSEDAATLWDTWAVFHEGTFYLYYLATSRTALHAEKDLALLRHASASSTSSKGQEADKCAPEKAFDGQYWTYWQADADESDARIQVDLGSVKDIGRVRIAWTRPGTPELFDLLVSSDGDEWTKIALGIDPGFRGSVTHQSGLDATGRYVRVHCRKHPAPESPIGYSLPFMGEGCRAKRGRVRALSEGHW